MLQKPAHVGCGSEGVYPGARLQTTSVNPFDVVAPLKRSVQVKGRNADDLEVPADDAVSGTGTFDFGKS